MTLNIIFSVDSPSPMVQVETCDCTSLFMVFSVTYIIYEGPKLDAYMFAKCHFH
jgi:hypothetical protein